MTALVAYGTRRLYQANNFYCVVIVRSSSLLKPGLQPAWDTRGGEELSGRVQIFKLCPKHFSKWGEKDFRGASSPETSYTHGRI